MNKNYDISTQTLFSGEVLAASGDATTGSVGLVMSTGRCKLQYAITGSGSVKVEVLESVDNSTFITRGASIGFKLTGSGILSYEGDGIPYVKFKITEDGGVSSATVTLKIAVS